ncbi:hypothetical protein BH09VER1_BH09VER1_48860 [soil metagenome]
MRVSPNLIRPILPPSRQFGLRHFLCVLCALGVNPPFDFPASLIIAGPPPIPYENPIMKLLALFAFITLAASTLRAGDPPATLTPGTYLLIFDTGISQGLWQQDTITIAESPGKTLTATSADPDAQPTPAIIAQAGDTFAFTLHYFRPNTNSVSDPKAAKTLATRTFTGSPCTIISRVTSYFGGSEKPPTIPGSFQGTLANFDDADTLGHFLLYKLPTK